MQGGLIFKTHIPKLVNSEKHQPIPNGNRQKQNSNCLTLLNYRRQFWSRIYIWADSWKMGIHPNDSGWLGPLAFLYSKIRWWWLDQEMAEKT